MARWWVAMLLLRENSPQGAKNEAMPAVAAASRLFQTEIDKTISIF